MSHPWNSSRDCHHLCCSLVPKLNTHYHEVTTRFFPMISVFLRYPSLRMQVRNDHPLQSSRAAYSPIEILQWMWHRECDSQRVRNFIPHRKNQVSAWTRPDQRPSLVSSPLHKELNTKHDFIWWQAWNGIVCTRLIGLPFKFNLGPEPDLELPVRVARERPKAPKCPINCRLELAPAVALRDLRSHHPGALTSDILDLRQRLWRRCCKRTYM